MTLCSFRVHNPDWGIRLYTSDAGSKHWHETITQDFETYQGDDWRSQICELGVEVIECDGGHSPNTNADIVRWKVLSEGAIFADMDIIFTRPFDDKAMELLSKDALTCVDGVLYLGLTSSSGSVAFKNIYEEALRKPEGAYQSAGVEAAYRYIHGHELCQGVYGKDTLRVLAEKSGVPVANMPKRWVHPVDMGEVFHRDYDFSNDPDVYGIHWWAGHNDGHHATMTYTADTHARNCVGIAADRAYSLWGQHA